jgi:hypothetical protein
MTDRICKASYNQNAQSIAKQWDEGALGGFVIENHANSTIGAKATKIQYKINLQGTEKSLLSIDNGKGMIKKRFKMMPDIGVDEEIERDPDDINANHEGIKGIIAKDKSLNVDYVREILTETKSNRDGNFYGSGRWYHDKKAKNLGEYTRFDDSYKKRNIIPYETGTAYELFLESFKLKNQLEYPYLRKLLIKYYAPQILGLYGNIETYLDDKKLQIVGMPTPVKESYPVKIRLSKNGEDICTKQITTCYFYKSDTTLPEQLHGVFLVVDGRIIQKREDYFGTYTPELKDKICVFICVDFLNNDLTRNKTSFTTNTTTRDAMNEASKIYKSWIINIAEGEKVKIKDEVAIRMEQRLNNLLNSKKWAPLKELFGPKIKIVQRPKKPCPNCGSLNYNTSPNDNKKWLCTDCRHSWDKEYVWTRPPCPNCGSLNYATSPDDNTMHKCNECGHIWKKKTPPPLIKKKGKWIGYDEQKKPKIFDESWITKDKDTGEVTISINIAMKTYKKVENDKKLKTYHLARVIASAVINSLDTTDEEKKKEMFFDLFEDLAVM